MTVRGDRAGSVRHRARDPVCRRCPGRWSPAGRWGSGPGHGDVARCATRRSPQGRASTTAEGPAGAPRSSSARRARRGPPPPRRGGIGGSRSRLPSAAARTRKIRLPLASASARGASPTSRSPRLSVGAATAATTTAALPRSLAGGPRAEASQRPPDVALPRCPSLRLRGGRRRLVPRGRRVGFGAGAGAGAGGRRGRRLRGGRLSCRDVVGAAIGRRRGVRRRRSIGTGRRREGIRRGASLLGCALGSGSGFGAVCAGAAAASAAGESQTAQADERRTPTSGALGPPEPPPVAAQPRSVSLSAPTSRPQPARFRCI